MCAQQPRRATVAGSADGPIRSFRPARLESRYQAVSEFHEIQSLLAGGFRFGRQPRTNPVGPGRLRPHRCECVSPDMGRFAVCRGDDDHGTVRSPRAWAFVLLGLDAYCSAVTEDTRAATLRLLLADRLIAVVQRGRNRGLGMVRGRPCLRQCPPAAGADPGRYRHPESDLSEDRTEVSALACANSRHPRPANSVRSAPKASAKLGGGRGRSISSRWKPTATIAACFAAWRADHDVEWKAEAARVFAWFLGSNDLSVAARRSGNRQLSRRPASRSSQREPGRRIGGVVPARPFRNSTGGPSRRKPRQADAFGRLTAAAYPFP